MILQVTVNEGGLVSEAKVIAGHPRLQEAAIAAVKQWQYSPTFLNGEAVPVMANIELVFVKKGDKVETGSGSDAPPLPRMNQMESFNRISAGQDWIIVSRATLIDENGSSFINIEDYRAPQVAWTPDGSIQWVKMAKAGWPADAAQGSPLSYSFVINKAGTLTNFQHVLGPEIPYLEKELSQLRVISPGLLGDNLVDSLCTIEINVGLASDEIQGLIESNYPPDLNRQ